MLEIKHLKTLQALRDTGRLTLAAERLHVTQSALSHQIKELEGRLGCELFVRKSRPLLLTGPGRRLLSLADKVMELVDDAERDVQKMVHGEAGRLHMAIECHSCFNWLMPTIEQYRQHWPEVELDFSSGFTFEPLPALAAGELDLVITADPLALKGVSYEPLFRYQMLIALANDHPLTEKPWLEANDLADQVLISYPVERSRLDIFKHLLTPAGVEPVAVRTAELTLMMVQLVASQRGVSALPDWVLREYVEQGLISVKPTGPDGVWLTLYAAVRESDRPAPYLQAFLAMAKAHCP